MNEMVPTLDASDTRPSPPPVVDSEFERIRHALTTQDNAITSDPIFLVQRRRRFIGVDPEYCENIVWVDSYTDDKVTRESDATKFADLEAKHEDDDPDDEIEGWIRTGYIDYWDFVQPFLTRESAEAFGKSQAHNLGEWRVYVESAYRNPEWKWLRKFFGGDVNG